MCTICDWPVPNLLHVPRIYGKSACTECGDEIEIDIHDQVFYYEKDIVIDGELKHVLHFDEPQIKCRACHTRIDCVRYPCENRPLNIDWSAPVRRRQFQVYYEYQWSKNNDMPTQSMDIPESSP